MRQQIHNAETPYQIYSLINSPYALTFLRFSQPYLSKEDFSSILADAWMNSEYANRDANVSKERLVSMFKQADRAKLMSDMERTQLDALADPVTVYRGVTAYNAENIRALSWTLDYDTAVWFAHRFGEDGMVYQAQIKKEHIPDPQLRSTIHHLKLEERNYDRKARPKIPKNKSIYNSCRGNPYTGDA